MQQRLVLLNNGGFAFPTDWTDHVLFGVPVWASHDPDLLLGYRVYFPYGPLPDEPNKVDWVFAEREVMELPPLERKNKQRFTLVPSTIKEGEKVWALITPITRINALDCPGCAFNKDLVNCKLAPACASMTRLDKQDVIFITAVEQW